MKLRAIWTIAGSGCLAAAVALASPALADVKKGVDAWERGDFAVAVAEWRDPAAAGDADAQFNLAQAYRLGRGVEADEKRAEGYYAKAAAQGHLKAADNYGLLLFQNGRRQDALPYVTAASDRGDPRAQYLLGIAHFNGDLVEKDWVRAYALLTNANAAGLPQAAPAIAQMDQHIPLVKRQEAQDLAATIKRESDTRRASQMAAADLASRQSQPSRVARTPSQPTAMRPAAPRAVARAADTIPTAIPTATVPPSVVAARNAVAEAARVTGTGSPAQAGADFARGTAAAPAPQSSPRPTSAPVSRPVRQAATAPAPTTPAPTTLAQANASGPWRVQLGAFSVKGNAERLWTRLAGRSALAGKQKFLVPAGRLTKLLAGGYSSRSSAQGACNSLKRGGQDCIVTR